MLGQRVASAALLRRMRLWRRGASSSSSAPLAFRSLPLPAGSVAQRVCEAAARVVRAEQCSVIQSAALPVLLQEGDAGEEKQRAGAVLLGAETGSGKTLAYLLPLLARALGEGEETALVLVPRRELGEQVLHTAQTVLREMEKQPTTMTTPVEEAALVGAQLGGAAAAWPYALARPAAALSVGEDAGDEAEGGEAEAPRRRSSMPPPRILVCTLAFLHKFVTRGKSSAGDEHLISALAHSIDTVVFDEADLLLDGGFRRHSTELVRALRSEAPDKGRQFILVAATLPAVGNKSIARQAHELFPDMVCITTAQMHRPHPLVAQTFERVEPAIEAKAKRVAELLQQQNFDTSEDGVIVFANTAVNAARVSRLLTDAHGVHNLELHKLVPPEQRAETIRAFRAGEVNVLVCTDLAARGMDFPRCTQVIQAEMASDTVSHLHRVGRASRGGRSGSAVALYDDAQAPLAGVLQRLDPESIAQTFSRNRSFRTRRRRRLRQAGAAAHS